ncbi:hypothetical protein D3C78_993860 [compost metagenome]
MSGLVVIRPGMLPEEKEYEGTCRNCNGMIRGKKRFWTVTDSPLDGETITARCLTPGCQWTVYGRQAK